MDRGRLGFEGRLRVRSRSPLAVLGRRWELVCVEKAGRACCSPRCHPPRPPGGVRPAAGELPEPGCSRARERLEGEVGGSAALVPQRVRRAWWLCGTENFASELGLAEIKEQRAASPPPQNSTQTPRRCCRLPSANSNEEQNTSGFKVFEVQNCLEYKGFWL